MKYEYQSETVPINDYWKENGEILLLNKMAEKGWRLISTTYLTKYNSILFIFEREQLPYKNK